MMGRLILSCVHLFCWDNLKGNFLHIFRKNCCASTLVGIITSPEKHSFKLSSCHSEYFYVLQIRKFYFIKILIIFLPINKNVFLGAQKNRLIETVLLSTHNKNRLIETVLLSTHNICFGWEIKKIIFQYSLLSEGLHSSPIFILLTCTISALFGLMLYVPVNSWSCGDSQFT